MYLLNYLLFYLFILGLWNSVICELQEARKNLDLPFIPFTGTCTQHVHCTFTVHVHCTFTVHVHYTFTVHVHVYHYYVLSA